MISFIKKFFIKSKWVFAKPQIKSLLLIDGIFDPLKFYYNEEDYNILYRRGEEYNFYVIIKCLFEFDLSSKNYIKNYVLFSKPRLIITAIHNYIGFYELSKLTGVKTMFIQSAITTEWGDLFGDKIATNKKNKKKFKVDYMLVFNSAYGKKFKRFIDGKYFVIGSFKNNLSINNTKVLNKKKEVLFISSYKLKEYSTLKVNNVPTYNFIKNEKKLFFIISKLCKENNLKLNILGKNAALSDGFFEKKYYEKIIPNKFKFIKNFYGRKTYKILNKYKYILTIDSTLAIENLSNGGRSGFLFNRPFTNVIKSRAFGYYEKIGRKGPFWTSYNYEDEIKRVFEYVIFKSDQRWKNITKIYINKIMPKDMDNKKFNSIIKNEIN